MPQEQQHQQKKKKKGHAPAHQNKFAFHHNPKSKTTAKILSAPIQHVCRRCHDKLEWRKQYRKYKPLTVPGKCNICEKRNITAAYHTICEACSRSSTKARTLLDELNKPTQKKDDEEGEEERGEERMFNRICAICVNEPALQGSGKNEDSDDHLGSLSGKKPRLRELKTLERQRARVADKGKARRRKDEGDGSSLGECIGSDSEESSGEDAAENFLVGEAYQQKLLQEQEQQLEQVKLS